MILINNVSVFGWEAAIRGMRNPMNSWNKSDSYWQHCYNRNREMWDSEYVVGNDDLKLMKNLVNAGSDHGKFMRMINVTMDINAPLYWWKEYDTYKIGTVANSCSTMHKIAAKEFKLNDFSHEHLTGTSESVLMALIDAMNMYRNMYLAQQSMPELERKELWWQMIQLLPSSYNQKRTVQLNYQVLKNMYHARKNHKLDEWVTFCNWIETLPYAKELIVGDE